MPKTHFEILLDELRSVRKSINHTEERILDKLEAAMKDHDERLRVVEMRTEKIGTKVAAIVAGISIIASIGVDWIKRLW